MRARELIESASMAAGLTRLFRTTHFLSASSHSGELHKHALRTILSCHEGRVYGFALSVSFSAMSLCVAQSLALLQRPGHARVLI